MGPRIVRALARQRTVQLFAPMAETRMDVGKRIRLGTRMVGQPLHMRTVPMASKMVVGLSRRLRIPRLRLWLSRVRVS